MPSVTVKEARPLEALPGDQDSPPPEQSTVRRVLRSESFVEKLALLVITVIASGILVPLIFAHLEARSEERQKAIEAARIRNQAILQAQSKLLDEFSETALSYQTLALDVSWYKREHVRNETLHQTAYERYSSRVVDIVARWRALASRAQTLTSPEVGARMDSFLNRVFDEQDTPMNVLYKNHADDGQWEKQHATNEQMLAETNSLISAIARDLGISKDNLYQ